MFSASYNEKDETDSMALSDEEVQWTRTVKAAALENESLKKLSDYEYVQHAMFTNGDVEKSLYQIEGMQHFREEYKITDTVEEGMSLFRQLHEQMPWVLLDIGYENDHFVLVSDYAQLNPSKLGLPEGWRTFLGGLYYVFQMVTSNFWAAREGLVIVAEIEGMGWQHFSIDLLKTYWEHFFCFFPLKHHELNWVTNSVIGNILSSLHKSIMDERCQNIQIGMKNKPFDGRLDGIFKVPTPEIAFGRFTDKCQFLLSKRFQHYQSYHLPPVLTEEDILFREALGEIEAALNQEEIEAGINQDSDDEDGGSEDEPEEVDNAP